MTDAEMKVAACRAALMLGGPECSKELVDALQLRCPACGTRWYHTGTGFCRCGLRTDAFDGGTVDG